MWIEIKTKEVLSNLDSQEVFGGEMGCSLSRLLVLKSLYSWAR